MPIPLVNGKACDLDKNFQLYFVKRFLVFSFGFFFLPVKNDLNSPMRVF